MPGGVTAADRAARNGHRAALIMFVGKAGTGKHQHARALERALFEAGRNVYMLDGQNVLLGVDHDLWVDAAQSELVRRFGEVAHLLLNAGLIVVSTTNAIGLADATAVQALIPDAPMLLIDVDPSGSSTQACDLRITGTEHEAEVIAQIVALLHRQQITTPSSPGRRTSGRSGVRAPRLWRPCRMGLNKDPWPPPLTPRSSRSITSAAWFAISRRPARSTARRWARSA